jgi:hypothetical protein
MTPGGFSGLVLLSGCLDGLRAAEGKTDHVSGQNVTGRQGGYLCTTPRHVPDTVPGANRLSSSAIITCRISTSFASRSNYNTSLANGRLIGKSQDPTPSNTHGGRYRAKAEPGETSDNHSINGSLGIPSTNQPPLQQIQCRQPLVSIVVYSL